MSSSATLRGTEKAAPDERRAAPRRNVMDRRLVTVNLDNKDAGLMVNLSEAGMAVQALARIKPGAATSLQFELPDTPNRIEANGTVVWVDPASGRAGIRFESLSEAAAGYLRKWLWLAAQDRPAARPAPSAPPSLAPERRAAEVASLQKEIVGRSLSQDAALALIARRVRTLTRADGVAIVLGDTKLMTCAASSGSAPPVGAELRPEVGLSGECVRTGVTVRCEDTEQDARVDCEACRSIGLRSAVVVPLFSRGNISGVLEVFYSSPNAFDGRDVLTLRRIADLIAATLSAAAPESKTSVRGSSAAAGQPPKPHAGRSGLPPPRSQTERVACPVCGHPNLPAARSCEKCQVPLAGRVTKAASSAGAPGLRSARNEETVPWFTLRLNASPRLLILLAVLLLLLGIWGWQEYRSRGTSAASPPGTTSTVETPASR